MSEEEKVNETTSESTPSGGEVGMGLAAAAGSVALVCGVLADGWDKDPNVRAIREALVEELRRQGANTASKLFRDEGYGVCRAIANVGRQFGGG